MAEQTKPDSTKKAAFLAAYAECGVISQACRAAEVARCSHYEWLQASAEYKEKFEEAHRSAVEALEAEARRRAVEGWEEPVFQGGELVGHKRRYSDMLLAMLLNGNLPEKYRNRVEHSGPQGGPIDVKHQVEELRIVIEEARRDGNYVQGERKRLAGSSANAGHNGDAHQSGKLANGSAPGID